MIQLRQRDIRWKGLGPVPVATVVVEQATLYMKTAPEADLRLGKPSELLDEGGGHLRDPLLPGILHRRRPAS